MEDNEKGGYSAEGRKLRPRRPRVSSDNERRYGTSSEGREFTETEYHRSGSYASSGRGGYGTSRSGDYERKPYSSREGSGDRGGYGSSRGFHNSDRYGSSQRGGFSRREGGYVRKEGDSRRGDYERKSYDRDGSHGRDGYEHRGGTPSNRSPYTQRDNLESRRGSYGPSESRNHGYKPYGAGSRGRREEGYGSSSERGNYEHRSYGRGGSRKFYDQAPGESRQDGYRRSKGQYGSDRGGFRRGNPNGGRYHFDEASSEGINKMLSRKTIIDQSQISDLDGAGTEVREEIRLNKFIANSGVCSRREADQFILAGVVTVNDEVVTELGTKVNVLKDEVKFNGERIQGEKKVYIVMNKPKGYVTTSSDPHAEKTVMDLLKGCTYRVFPVGRLDKSTTGVLMFTNDGDIAEKLTHPSYNKKKIYQVILDNPLSEEDKEKVLTGVSLSDGEAKADELEYIDAEDHRKLGVEIHSGKNRIVRRMFESIGYDVKALDRVYFAGLTKKGLKKGEWRYLSDGEANLIKMGAYL